MSDVPHEPVDEGRERRRRTWLRGFFMLVFAIFFGIAQWILNLVTLAQFLWLLFAGARNDVLSRFGASMALWLADVARFQSCDSENKPFPWREWPAAPAPAEVDRV